MRETKSKCQPSPGARSRVKERDHRDWSSELEETGSLVSKVQGGGEFKYDFLKYLWESMDFICFTYDFLKFCYFNIFF